MLKLISVLVAICAMTVSINVSAATSNGSIASDTRNDVNELGTSYDGGSLPTFRAGDTLQFDVSDLTADTTLTLISYKYDSERLNSTVQYINEYTIASSSVSTQEDGTESVPVEISKTIDYKIRDIDDGIYKIQINGNDKKGIAEFYYKVGTPKVSIVEGAEGTNYYVSEAFEQADGSNLYSVAFVAKATIGGNVSFEEVGLESVGLEFNLKDKNSNDKLFKDLTPEQINALLPKLEELQNSEINGSVTLYFGVTMLRIPKEDMDQIKATPRLDGVAVSAE